MHDDEPRVWRFGTATFDEARHLLTVNGTSFRITGLTHGILGMLLRADGRVVTRGELIDGVWKDPETSDQAVDRRVSGLRAMLASNDVYIKSVWGKGWQFDSSLRPGLTSFPVDPRVAARIELTTGAPIPNCSGGWVLQDLLGQSPGRQVWRARRSGTAEVRVFEIGTDDRCRPTMEQEQLEYQKLEQLEPLPSGFVRVFGVNLQHRPFYRQREDGGLPLLVWAAEGGRLSSMNRAQRHALCVAICEIIAKAHNIEALHGDLTPASILIAGGAEDPRVKIGGFGGSRFVDGAPGLKNTSAPYAAPELLTSPGMAVTPQSDGWSLAQIVAQIWQADPRFTLHWRREADFGDPVIREAIERASHPDPDQRDPVHQFLARLRSWDADSAGQGVPTSQGS